MGSIRIKGGRLVDPFALTREDVAATDFCHALACINRYTGHARYPFPVGQHVYILYMHVPAHLRKAALIHDNPEVYFNDLASPVKARFASYKKYEKAAMVPVREYFGVTQEELDEFDKYDKAIYINERNVLFDSIGDLGMGDERTGLDIQDTWFSEWSWKDTSALLRSAYNEEFGI